MPTLPVVLTVVVDFTDDTATRRSEPVELGSPVELSYPEIDITVGAEHPHPVRILPKGGRGVASVTYFIRAPMRNFSAVIAPDSGRWYTDLAGVTSFWKHGRTLRSRIHDVRPPLYLFLSPSGHVCTAMGVIGALVETDFRLEEPESNRALNVHTGGVTVAIQRGSADVPLSDVLLDDEAGFTEHVFARAQADSGDQSWTDVFREYSRHEGTSVPVADAFLEHLDPYWCSWTDWDSSEVNDQLILDNVEAGVRLGVKNYIIDDGWFGPGLDASYADVLNIGDWEPDTNRFKDMTGLVRRTRDLGARLLIWCAPHAVGPRSRSAAQHAHLLMQDREGTPLRSETQFHTLCFRSPHAREVMLGICEKLAHDLPFDGAKYDLFNWIPDAHCRSTQHEHDTPSDLQGLEMVLAGARRRTEALSPRYIIELKQNYGTSRLAQYGSVMRAGDAPFDPTTNFARIQHIQGYSPAALSDYQTFNQTDSDEDVAIAVIQMLALGVPSYGTSLAQMSASRGKVLAWHHHLFEQHRDAMVPYRVIVTPGAELTKAAGAGQDVWFITGECSPLRIDRPALVLNGKHSSFVPLSLELAAVTEMLVRDCQGQVVRRDQVPENHAHVITLEVPLGGSLETVCS